MSASAPESVSPPPNWREPRSWPLALGLGVLAAAGRLPERSWPVVSRGLGALLRALSPSRRRVVALNLGLAFPDRDEAWCQWVLRESYRQLGLSLLENGRLWFSRRGWAERYTRVELAPGVAESRADGEPLMLVTYHHLAVEVAAAALGEQLPYSAVFAPAKNPHFDAFHRRQRLRFVPELVPRTDMRRAMRCLREGGALSILPDQVVQPHQGGVPTTFFAQPVLSSPAVARLGRRCGARMSLVEIARDADGRLVVRVGTPEPIPEDADPPAVAQMINDRFEAAIRRQPGGYFWHHKRFKPVGIEGATDPYRRRRT